MADIAPESALRPFCDLPALDRAKAITLLTLAEVWQKLGDSKQVSRCLADLRAVLEGRAE